MRVGVADVGLGVGTTEDWGVGTKEGLRVGVSDVGMPEGWAVVGLGVGTADVGTAEGFAVGAKEGLGVGDVDVGMPVGPGVGTKEGLCVGAGSDVVGSAEVLLTESGFS